MDKCPPIPPKFRIVDELARPDHGYLQPDDRCYYVWEWVKEALYRDNQVNDFVGNLQKDPKYKADFAWRYKRQAIKHAANTLGSLLPNQWLEVSTIVPIPPSKTKTHEAFDSRLLDVLSAIAETRPFDFRELILQRTNTVSREKGIDPDQRAANWVVDENFSEPAPTSLIVFDDLLTTGSHFKAAQQLLQGRFPEATVIGVFLARRVFPDEEDPFS